jgi:hypothetical protein
MAGGLWDIDKTSGEVSQSTPGPDLPHQNQTQPPPFEVGVFVFQGDDKMLPWRGKRYTRISLEDLGLDVRVNLTPGQVRQIIQSLDPGALAIVQEAIATGDPDLTRQARRILGSAILEWVISNPN